MLAFFQILAPDTFLSGTTIQLVLGEGVVTCLLVPAFLIPMAAGSYDLSVKAMLGFPVGVPIFISLHSGLAAVPGGVVPFLACALVGAVNGFLIVKLRVTC